VIVEVVDQPFQDLAASETVICTARALLVRAELR
jgi:hypothetical protein